MIEPTQLPPPFRLPATIQTTGKSMNEPTDPTDGPSAPAERPAAPSPFDRPGTEQGRFAGPGPGPGPDRRPGPGVGKPLLIGCGFLLLLALLALVLGAVYQNKLTAVLFGVMEKQLEPMIPDDLPPDVRQRYDAAFDGAIEAMRAGEANPFAMQDFARVTRDLSSGDGTLSVEDVERLTAALEKIPVESAEEAPEDGADGAPGSTGRGNDAAGADAPPATSV
jgi:hypothetical protein